MEGFFLERHSVKTAGAKDLNGSALVGARLSMAHSDKVAIAVYLGASAASTVNISLKQHTAGTGGTTAILATTNTYFHKVASASEFTKVELTAVADTFNVSSIFSTVAGWVVFEVYGEDLDVNDGYNHISVDIAATAVAKDTTAVYILHDMKYNPAYKVAI
jgi:hypothetical protein